MSAIDWQIQRGPCQICGATNYPLSMGGPTICPSCDCGPPNPRHVRRLRESHDRLHRILNHIAEKGVQGDRITLIRKWGMSATSIAPEDRVKVLIEEVEAEISRSKPQTERTQ